MDKGGYGISFGGNECDKGGKRYDKGGNGFSFGGKRLDEGGNRFDCLKMRLLRVFSRESEHIPTQTYVGCAKMD